LLDALVEPVARAVLIAAPADQHRADRDLTERDDHVLVGPADCRDALGVLLDGGLSEGVLDGHRELVPVSGVGAIGSVVLGAGVVLAAGVAFAARVVLAAGIVLGLGCRGLLD